MLEKLKDAYAAGFFREEVGAARHRLARIRKRRRRAAQLDWVIFFSGIKSGAIRFLNYLAYYEMKKRAGTVGQKGVGPLLDRLA
jgi:hypothetical protein